jgi:hypothetical protein
MKISKISGCLLNKFKNILRVNLLKRQLKERINIFVQYVDATDVLKTRQDCQPKTFDIYNYMVDYYNNYGCINDLCQ